ncbi:MAG: translation initiation factor IF-2 associated domain-containing protein, partial [Betaproteobacteria bacterium]
MSSTTVAEFATELKKSTETLLEQLKSAGVAKSAASDKLTEADKQRLLGFLQASHGTASPERKKITLVKKSTSEIKQADATGKARTIQVEVRKKRTFDYFKAFNRSQCTQIYLLSIWFVIICVGFSNFNSSCKIFYFYNFVFWKKKM